VDAGEGELEGEAWLASVRVTPGAKRNDRGDSVKWVQRGLIRLGWLSGSADGIFGAKTEAALRAFQGDAGLEESGVADLQTLRALCLRAAG